MTVQFAKGVVLAILHMNEESSALGLEINWNKTRIQASDIIVGAPPDVTILGHKVNVVDSFVYLGSSIDASGETILIFVEELSRPVHA